MYTLLISLCVIIIWIAPSTTVGYVAMTTSYIIFILIALRENFKIRISGLILLLTLAIAYIGALISKVPIDTVDHIRFVQLCIILPFASRLEVKHISPIVLLGISLFIMCSQIVYILNIEEVIIFYNKLYTYTGDRVGLSPDYLINNDSKSFLQSLSKRYGGIYFNPNQAGKHLCALAALACCYRKSQDIILIGIVVICGIGVLLTGSRTAFVCFTGIIGISLIQKLSLKYLINTLIIVLLTSSIVLIVYNPSNVIDLSAFRILTGFSPSDLNDGSLGAKANFLYQYIVQIKDPIVLLLGNYTTNFTFPLYGIETLDNELNETIYRCGIFGLIAYCIYTLGNLNLCWTHRNYHIIMIYLWIFTSTVIFSYRMAFMNAILLLVSGKKS